jgi:hypothetical protein
MSMRHGPAMTPNSAYSPHQPAKRPGGRPETAPTYRVAVHRQYKPHYDELVDRVGLKQAQQFWDHVAYTPGVPDPIAQTCILSGKAGKPKGAGWSRTFHYEVSSSARINYQYNDAYKTSPDGDSHRVATIETIDYSSH